MMHEYKEIKEVLLTEEQIRARVNEMGRAITERYRDKKEVVLIGILKGSVLFMADLARQIDMPVTFDFMAVSSYGKSTTSSGVVRILKDLDSSVEGKHVIIVEDIIDSGHTLNYIRDNLEGRGAESVSIVTLFNKPNRRKAEMEVDLVGFTLPDAFVVGYGLDFAEKYRNLPYLAVLHEDAYSV
ncbi:MAG: hypoxanthine phosphoribosyltransferase [Peptoniphilaceae bacterium]|jgi:hypoxanthine phosphoribosyltransferase